MRPGDDVVYTPDVLNYGIGRVLWVEPDGRLMVEFDDDHAPDWMPPHRETFHASELELAAIWMRAA